MLALTIEKDILDVGSQEAADVEGENAEDEHQVELQLARKGGARGREKERRWKRRRHAQMNSRRYHDEEEYGERRESGDKDEEVQLKGELQSALAAEVAQQPSRSTNLAWAKSSDTTSAAG